MLKKGLLSIFIILIAVTGLQAQTTYKKFDTGKTADTLLEINLTKNKIAFNFKNDGLENNYQFTKKDITVDSDRIAINGDPIMTNDSFVINGQTVDINLIDKVEINVEDDFSNLIFLKASGTSKYTFKSRKKNVLAMNEKISIPSDQFVRGSVIAFWGDITIEGEINEDVVAVFGNITISNKAVIRGHVAAIGGKVKVTKEATVYGNVMSSGQNNNYAFSKNRKGIMLGKYISNIYRLFYNRVDGIAPYFGFRFFENDTLIPEFTLYGGYGFASEQPRCFFGVEHSLSIPNELIFGGSIYKKLVSDDDWIISETNNTIYALTATEDYKNYYDAQGGNIYAGYYPLRNLFFKIGLNIEKHKWLSAHPELWSLTGSSKEFHSNYSNLEGYEDSVRSINGKKSETFKFFRAELNFKPPKEGNNWNSSYWAASMNLEWFPEGMNDGLEYNRLLIKGKRQQKLSKKFVMRSELTFGSASNRIPDYRKFSIGGMGTLPGYQRKEFTGTDFWLGNIELGFKAIKEEILLWLFYDAAVIDDEMTFLSDPEVLNSLGAGISLADYIRLYVARRFDCSEPDMEFGVKVGLSF